MKVLLFGRHFIDKDLIVEVYSDGVQLRYKGEEYVMEKPKEDVVTETSDDRIVKQKISKFLEDIDKRGRKVMEKKPKEDAMALAEAMEATSA